MRLRTFHCVKLDGDDDRQCVAAASRNEALALLIAPLSADEACRQVASTTVRAFDAGAARLKAQGPWIYGMRANQYVCPGCGEVNRHADEEGAVDGPREYHADCWARQ